MIIIKNFFKILIIILLIMSTKTDLRQYKTDVPLYPKSMSQSPATDTGFTASKAWSFQGLKNAKVDPAAKFNDPKSHLIRRVEGKFMGPSLFNEAQITPMQHSNHELSFEGHQLKRSDKNKYKDYKLQKTPFDKFKNTVKNTDFKTPIKSGYDKFKAKSSDAANYVKQSFKNIGNKIATNAAKVGYKAHNLGSRVFKPINLRKKASGKLKKGGKTNYHKLNYKNYVRRRPLH